MTIRIGTRGSRLALHQARMVARMLGEQGHETTLTIIKTAGDRDRDSAFVEVGEPGIFVREIETALLEERVDLAVHSYKDVPSKSPERLVIAAVPERVDTADRLLVRLESVADGAEAGPLPVRHEALIGSASARRKSLLKYLRPDLRTGLLRGNLPTRVRRVVEGDFDATLLASAGLTRLDRDPDGERLDRTGIHEARLDPERFIPAPSQGAVAVQVRRDDDATRAAAVALDAVPAHRAVRAERSLLAKVEGGCQVPFGAWCRLAGDGGNGDGGEGGGRLVMDAFLERGGVFAFVRGEADDPEELAGRLWDELQLRVAAGKGD